MSLHGRLCLRLRTLRRDKRGIAVPTALMALVASFALASVAVLATVDVQRGHSARPRAPRNAIAAADAGAEHRAAAAEPLPGTLIRRAPRASGPSGEYQTASSAGWCPSDRTANRSATPTYSYRVSAFTTVRRTERRRGRRLGHGQPAGRASALNSVSGKNVFAEREADRPGQRSTSQATAVNIRTDIGTNGDIEAKRRHPDALRQRSPRGRQNGAGPELRQGKIPKGTRPCRTPLTAPANIATENDDCRPRPRTAPASKAGKVDTYSEETRSKTRSLGRRDSKIINVSAQRHADDGRKRLLGLRPLHQPPGRSDHGRPARTVRIFVDTPEHCGLEIRRRPGRNQRRREHRTRPDTTLSEGIFEVPGIYLLGDGSREPRAAPRRSNELMLYAPESARSTSAVPPNGRG